MPSITRSCDLHHSRQVQAVILFSVRRCRYVFDRQLKKLVFPGGHGSEHEFLRGSISRSILAIPSGLQPTRNLLFAFSAPRCRRAVRHGPAWRSEKDEKLGTRMRIAECPECHWTSVIKVSSPCPLASMSPGRAFSVRKKFAFPAELYSSHKLCFSGIIPSQVSRASPPCSRCTGSQAPRYQLAGVACGCAVAAGTERGAGPNAGCSVVQSNANCFAILSRDIIGTRYVASANSPPGRDSDRSASVSSRRARCSGSCPRHQRCSPGELRGGKSSAGAGGATVHSAAQVQHRSDWRTGCRDRD